MKILFISGCYPPECYDELQKQSKVPLQNAPNTFQWAVINGLYENNCDFKVACVPFLPSYPIRYRKLFTPEGHIRYQGEIVGDYLKATTLLGFKKKSQSKAIYHYTKDWCEKNQKEDKLAIVVYTSWYYLVSPILKLKKQYPQVVIVPIITDLIDDALNFSSNRTLSKRLMIAFEKRREKEIYKRVDKFILLSKAMEERIPEAKDRNITVEGIYSRQSEVGIGTGIEIIKSNIRSILYTGSLHKFAGIMELIDSFMQIENDHYKLIICGSGECESYIEKMSKIDKRIVYKGVLSRQKVIELQHSSTLLINPRRPDNTITKYSFPSKTMEYLASGTPMIGYKLEGIPKDYYHYYYTIEDLSREGLANSIKRIMELPENDLKEKGAMARAFILNNKDSYHQVSKILEFLCS